MARMRDKQNAKRRSGKIIIPGMRDVEGKIRLPEGEYIVEVADLTSEDGQEHPYLKWKFRVAEGDKKGGILYYNTSLAPQALWNLRNLLEALQADIPDDETEMDTDDYLGMKMVAVVEHDTYEGKRQSRLVDFWPLEGEGSYAGDKSEGEEEEQEEEPRGKGRRAQKRAAAKAARDDGEEENADGDGGNEEEAEEQDNSRRSRRSRDKGSDKKAAKAKKSLSQDELEDMGEDELADVVSEFDLDVDLDGLATLRKKRAAVIDALDDAGALKS